MSESKSTWLNATVRILLVMAGSLVWITWGAWETLDIIRDNFPLYESKERIILNYTPDAYPPIKVILIIIFIFLFILWLSLPFLLPLAYIKYNISINKNSKAKSLFLVTKEIFEELTEDTLLVCLFMLLMWSIKSHFIVYIYMFSALALFLYKKFI